VLILTDGRSFPVDATQALTKFLDAGGTVVFFGGPPLSKLVVWHGGRWLTQADVRRALEDAPPEVPLLDLSLTSWQRDSNSPTSEYSIQVEDGPADAGKALRVHIADLKGWDTITSPKLQSPFAGGRSVTSFWAKGDERTPQLSVEWREKDGSRWIAVVDITTAWKRYALLPADFKYWSDNPSAGRGGKGDSLKVENAETITFGLAESHTSQPRGEHTYWIAGISTAHDPFKDVDFTPPVIESISPAYKTFRMQSAILHPTAEHMDVFQQKLEGTADLVCQIWRSRGLGASPNRLYRWAPLLYGVSGSGGIGVGASVTNFGKGAVAFFGFDDPAFVSKNLTALASAVANAAHRLAERPLFLCAGTDAFVSWDGKPVLGAVITRVKSSDHLVVEFIIENARGRQVFYARDHVQHSASGSARVTERCPKLEPGTYSVRCQLMSGAEAIDSISHEFRVLEPGQAPEDYVIAKNGDFWVGEKVWRGIGINYWPLYSVGREPDRKEGTWLSPERYDPEVVERDLATLERLGMNLVSIQYLATDEAPALADFLHRCRAHNIKANIFLDGAHPLSQDGKKAIELIRAARLPQMPAIFAYDLGWEVRVGDEKARAKWDQEWQNWVIEQYGSVENAVSDWGFTPKVDAQKVISGPSDDQLTQDGQWRRMVAAYRRFWDDFISERYRKITRMVRDVDPVHLVGVRSGFGGTGSLWPVKFMPFDLASGVIYLDFTSPEGYGLGMDWPGFQKGGLTTAYGRFVSGGKPVYWAEYGMSIWPRCGEAEKAQQGEYYRLFYRMLAESGANAGAGWWYPGGLRVDEQSDYGIMNPDCTPRPAAQVSPADFYQAPSRKEPDYFIQIDRDLYVTGYAGVFAAHSDEYVRAANSGKTVALKTAGTGTDSSNVPLIAVGNVPYNGNNPLKYLNADLEVEHLKRTGATVEIAVRAGNTGEAKWLAPRPDLPEGGVYLLAKCEGKEWKLALTSDVPYLSSTRISGVLDGVPEGKSTIELRMMVEGRASFGRKVRLEIGPRGRSD